MSTTPQSTLTRPVASSAPPYTCRECGATSPGAGVRRQSQAMVRTASGIEVRRGGRCRTCRRIAARAALAFDAAGVAYLAEHGRGISGPARRPIQDAAIQAGHAARLAVLTAEVERAARRAARQAVSA